MQRLEYQRNFCEGRRVITDNELYHLTEKYHHRHPTFTIEIQERTCKTIILACIYHYRHIEVDLRCQCIYDDNLHKFQTNWSTNHSEYKKMFNDILLRLSSSLINRLLDDQIESIIEQLTKYFVQLKSIREDEERERQQSTITKWNNSTVLSPSIEIVKYERSPQSQRKQFLERSLSWSQSSTTTVRTVLDKCNSILDEKNVK